MEHCVRRSKLSRDYHDKCRPVVKVINPFRNVVVTLWFIICFGLILTHFVTAAADESKQGGRKSNKRKSEGKRCVTIGI